MKKVKIKIPLSWSVGIVRHSHLERILHVENEEELKTLLSDPHLDDHMWFDFEIDEFRVEDYGGLGEPEVIVLEETED